MMSFEASSLPALLAAVAVPVEDLEADAGPEAVMGLTMELAHSCYYTRMALTVAELGAAQLPMFGESS